MVGELLHKTAVIQSTLLLFYTQVSCPLEPHSRQIDRGAKPSKTGLRARLFHIGESDDERYLI